MKLFSTIGGEDVTFELPRDLASPLTFVVDGETGEADVRRVGPGAYSIIADGTSYDVRVYERSGGNFDVAVNGVTHQVVVKDPRRWTPGEGSGGSTGSQQVKAPMPGKVVKLLVHEGEEVEAGQGLVIIEAMKMQNEMKSPRAGTIANVKVAEGGPVAAGDVLVVVG